jgi:hypothetical protein
MGKKKNLQWQEGSRFEEKSAFTNKIAFFTIIPVLISTKHDKGPFMW